MSFGDKILGPIFPTRNGGVIGTSQENRMLDGVGGSGQIRTKILLNTDGSITMLRTRGGFPEFTTTKPSVIAQAVCNLFMDSGIVDLHGAGDLHPNLMEPGDIYATDFVSASIPSGEGVGVGELHPPDEISGTLPADGSEAQSFGIDPAWYSDKKTVAWHVPASMFTGRTRLYVQSLYGGTRRDIVLSEGNGVRPFLTVSTTARESAQYPAIPISTGSGVFLDQSDWSHWLINLTTDTAYIYRLTATACAEKLRPLLSGFSGGERERIEAYLLSQSVPDVSPSYIVNFTPTPDSAMGYSWHWNYDGTRCDIVDVVEAYITTIGASQAWGFESTHYRLTLTRGSGFAIDRGIISGPSKWSVPKNQNVIAYPDWLNNNLVKAGNLPSGINDASMAGVVYTFYSGNELRTVNYSGTPSFVEKSRTSSPQYFGGLYYETNSQGLLNAQENGVSVGKSSHQVMRHEFSCAGVIVGGENSALTGNEKTATWSGRTTGAVIGTVQPGNGTKYYYGLPSLSGITYSASGSVATATATWGSYITLNPSVYANSRTYDDIWDITSSTFTETVGSFSLIVIPFMDAQAVYLGGSGVRTKSGTRISGQRRAAPDVNYGSWNYIYRGNTSPWMEKYAPCEVFTAAAPPGVANVSNPFSDVETTEQPFQLICTGGVLGASPQDVSPFYTALNSVSQSWGTLSSVNGVAISESNDIQSGTVTSPQYPSLVGWA